jgi:HK97 family phage prohead protease
MDNVLLHDGEPLRAQGFAVTFDREAETETGIETFRAGAFASFLASGTREAIATWAHNPDFTWARTADKSLELWETSTGLAFSATIEATQRGLGLAHFIAQGHAVCSITFEPLDCVKTAAGRMVTRANLTEICVFFEASYPTACWLAGDAQPDNLTPYAASLRERWLDGRSVRLAGQNERLLRAYSSPAARTRARAAAPAISDAEAFGPPPGNLSMEEWMDFGRSCAHAARWMRPHNRSRRASQ